MRLEGKSLRSDFLKFIIPSIVAQWVFTLYTMIDGIFVAKGVSETALTAVNISFPFVAALFSVSILFAVSRDDLSQRIPKGEMILAALELHGQNPDMFYDTITFRKSKR